MMGLEQHMWTTEAVIDFVNWYIKLNRLDIRFELENTEIINSFLRGDSVDAWHVIPITSDVSFDGSKHKPFSEDDF